MPDIIDTRDLYKRQCDLQEEYEMLNEAVETQKECLDDMVKLEEDSSLEEAALQEAKNELESWELEYLEELEELDELETQISDWIHGETLINEDYFEEYAEDLANDLYDMQNDSWPFYHIDWEAAAEDLKQDYTEVEYDGETYYCRA